MEYIVQLLSLLLSSLFFFSIPLSTLSLFYYTVHESRTRRMGEGSVQKPHIDDPGFPTKEKHKVPADLRKDYASNLLLESSYFNCVIFSYHWLSLSRQSLNVQTGLC